MFWIRISICILTYIDFIWQQKISSTVCPHVSSALWTCEVTQPIVLQVERIVSKGRSSQWLQRLRDPTHFRLKSDGSLLLKEQNLTLFKVIYLGRLQWTYLNCALVPIKLDHILEGDCLRVPWLWGRCSVHFRHRKFSQKILFLLTVITVSFFYLSKGVE